MQAGEIPRPQGESSVRPTSARGPGATARSALRDARRWSRDTPVPSSQIIGAAAGLGGPVACGVVTAHTVAGMLAALGALAAGGITATGVTATGVTRLAGAAATAVAAGFTGVSIAGRGWVTAVAVVVTAAVVPVLGGFSRPAAEISTRFVTFVVITTGLGPVGDPLGVTSAFAVGAGWSMLVALLIAFAGRLAVRRGHAPPAQETPSPPLKALLRRWRASLRAPHGWQYALRLALCLAIAETIEVLWRQPKAYWIAVTVVIVVQRGLDQAVVRVVQRAAGTVAGVVVGSVVLLWVLPPWLLVPIVAALAALRPLLRARNYALYATAMTPLVVLLMDGGQGTPPSTIAYRVVDTVLGCAIAIGAGYLPWTRLRPAPRQPAGNRTPDGKSP
ncbi:FUSC family protein [Streptosporangium sp. NPDC000396]|uniref:FUSC family protein n=1 Tax=Streptosporangium sp. NPDC000396 TaxID=3366185 RepID=UPI003696A497